MYAVCIAFNDKDVLWDFAVIAKRKRETHTFRQSFQAVVYVCFCMDTTHNLGLAILLSH